MARGCKWSAGGSSGSKLRLALALMLVAGAALCAGCSLLEKKIEALPGYEARLPYGYGYTESAYSGAGANLPKSNFMQSRAFHLTHGKDSHGIELSVMKMNASAPAGTGFDLMKMMGDFMKKGGMTATLEKSYSSDVCTFDAKGYPAPAGGTTAIFASCRAGSDSWMVIWSFPGACEADCEALMEKFFGSLHKK